MAVLCAVSTDVATIVIDDPSTKNALTVTDRATLAQLLAELDLRDDVGVVVLRGANGTFCSGGNIREFGRLADESAALRYAREVAQPVFRSMKSISKPTISVVQGSAAGAGMFLALAADVCIADSEAVFSASQLQLGVPPDWGGMWLLPRLVGAARARAIALRPRPIPAPTAHQWGLIAECVPCSGLELALKEWCDALSALPAGAVHLTRRGLDISPLMGSDDFLAYEMAAIAATAGGDEHRRHVANYQVRGKGLKE